MACSILDSSLLRNNFGTPEMREIFDDKTIVQNWLDFEAALAQTQAELGVIPKEAAEEITKKADVNNLDLAQIEEVTNKIGHPLVPVLRAFQRVCDKDYGEYIHLGATTQDIIDTGYMMSIKRAFDIIYADMRDIEAAILVLAEKYADTVMAGRTHGQQAIPITFGYKAAVWASEVRRSIERMKECRERCLVGQLSGAVGTMAGFGEHAIEISNRAIKRIGLGIPDIAWHASRDRIAELVSVIGIAAATLGRIGNEVFNLQKTEFSELAEGFTKGAVGSSTMPHKRNPRAPEALHCLARVIKSTMELTFESMFSQNERDGALWRVEWKTVNEVFIMMGAATSRAKALVTNLQVNEASMRKNLDILKGLMMSEPLMLVLGEKVGKQTAHEIVYEISMEAFEQNASFLDKLLENKTVTDNISRAELERLLDPSQYTGYSSYFAKKICEEINAARERD